jgi:Zn-dependent peptidase ImmA (M78 family)
VCVYDFAEKSGIEVRFLDIPSLEEMYCRKSKPAIIVSSLRPAGRQAFNCAHGLGHHVFKHGTRVDEIVCQSTTANVFDPEEFLADCFAGFFLMTRVAVSRAFAVRDLTPEKCTPTDIYLISNWFGVGYSTLINHMSLTLKLISPGKANELLRVSRKQIRSTLIDEGNENNVILVDHHWQARAIDCQVGDFIMLPSHTYLEGSVATYAREIKNGPLFSSNGARHRAVPQFRERLGKLCPDRPYGLCWKEYLSLRKGI